MRKCQLKWGKVIYLEIDGILEMRNAELLCLAHDGPGQRVL